MGFRANARLILLLIPLLWATTALLAFIALGFDVYEWNPSIWTLYLSRLWPIGLPILALFG